MTHETVPPMRKVMTFGTFDLFHYGHLRILERARKLGTHLIVGVSSDELNISKKGRPPVTPLAQRVAILEALRCVDLVFVEELLELKGDYIRAHGADVLVMGHDWAGRFDMFKAQCEVVYLDRTPQISTTELIERIRI
jgi:glycerol-3-phosphate cytidylyltransferase